MNFTLKRPCENCPFTTKESRIKFACKERAEEIAEIAYRQGFACHVTGEDFEDRDGSGYIDFASDGSSSFCGGALLMFLKEGTEPVQFERLNEYKKNVIRNRLDWDAPVFESEEDFINANA